LLCKMWLLLRYAVVFFLDAGYLILLNTQHPVSSLLFLGDNSGGVTPVPIPNTAVKTSCADGTSRATSWESRTLPRISLAC
jgi:hypothetical protein